MNAMMRILLRLSGYGGTGVSCTVFGGIGDDVVLPAVAMLALAGPSRRRQCPDVASAKSGIENFSKERGARSM
jgi:hypothetical protein